MSWRLAKSLATLRDQINAKYPNRSKSDDGTIGDARHQASVSDHNPDSGGVVRAMDITHDPAHGMDTYALAETLRLNRDPRIKYVISNGRIWSSGVAPYSWRAYGGSNRHDRHVHISVVADKRADDTSPWKLDRVSPAIPTFPFSGKGSWFSQFHGGKYNWVDEGDEPNSNALGVPDSKQGISFYDRATLGKWFEVLAPNGHISIERQTDIGPHPRTGRKIDISAAAAERFGYSPRNFPTDSIFHWRPVDAPKG